MSAPPTTGVEDEFYHVTPPTTGVEGGAFPCQHHLLQEWRDEYYLVCTTSNKGLEGVVLPCLHHLQHSGGARSVTMPAPHPAGVQGGVLYACRRLLIQSLVCIL
jgi:hypothetical protein